MVKKFLITGAIMFTFLFVSILYSDGVRRKEDARESERAEFVKQARAQDAIEAAARLAVIHYDPAAKSLCPPPYRMTARDGCQPAHR